MSTLIWFRDDLRLADHPALHAAADDPDGVVALYILDEESPGARPLGGAARWWLHHSLTRLAASLAELGIPLVLRRGAAAGVLASVVRETGVARVVWNRRYGAERHIDATIKHDLRAAGVAATSFAGSLLHEPWTVQTGEGRPYRVYTPFWRACLAGPPPAAPLAAPTALRQAAPARSELLADWALTPSRPDWSEGLAVRWVPGEQEALAKLDRFVASGAPNYASRRDFPAETVGSELSPHLRWGEISPRTIWARALASGADLGTFLSEVGWREFAWHTTFHHTADPGSAGLHTLGINAQFDAFPWRDPAAHELRAWQRGETGFGLVDAGMRELWQSGFMHNRVRMVTASFLTKNLLVDWRVGEAWFWDTLVDADAASNPFNWQWVAGCGVDAAPYFRVFNPRTQEQKFDRAGEYVQAWAPDSAMLPELVDLRGTRVAALAAYDSVKGLARER